MKLNSKQGELVQLIDTTGEGTPAFGEEQEVGEHHHHHHHHHQ